jgi:hypothetical protein
MPGSDPYARTRARVTKAIADALGEIDNAVQGRDGATDEAAYQQASWLTETFREATISAGQMRAALVLRVQQAGDLSLARLGDKLSISKARADDLVRAAQGRRKERKKARRTAHYEEARRSVQLALMIEC